MDAVPGLRRDGEVDVSVTAAATKTALATAATGAAAAAAGAAAEPSIFDVLVLGIPLGVLTAALGGSAAQYLHKPAQPDRNLPRELRGVLIDGFIGGWLAMFLVGFKWTAPYVHAIAPAVVGALCALLVQFLREHGKSYFDEAFQVALGLFRRRQAGGKP